MYHPPKAVVVHGPRARAHTPQRDGPRARACICARARARARALTHPPPQRDDGTWDCDVNEKPSNCADGADYMLLRSARESCQVARLRERD